MNILCVQLPVFYQDADLSVNIAAICKPVPPSNDVIVIIKVDGIETDTDVPLPSSGCRDIECILTRGEEATNLKTQVCRGTSNSFSMCKRLTVTDHIEVL